MGGEEPIFAQNAKGIKMIKLLYGEDQYQIEQRMAEIKNTNSPSEVDINVFDNTLNFQEIKSATDTLPLLAEKKLVIIKSLSSIKDHQIQSEVKSWLNELSDNIDIILVEEKLTAKNWLLEAVKLQGKIDNFNIIKPFEVAAYIVKVIQKKGGSIESKAAEKLALIIGPDLAMLENEINKLLTYDKDISLSAVNELSHGELSDSIFALLDAVSEKKSGPALILLNNFLREDDSDIYLITMLARQIRNLLSVKDLVDEGKREHDIEVILKLHPFVVKKCRSQSHNFSREQLLILHQQIVEADATLKSTNISPKVILTQLIYNACK